MLVNPEVDDMSRCTAHKKDFLGDCMWCGKNLCGLCIAKQEGRKLYCEHCAINLLPYKRERLPLAQPKKVVAEPAQQVPAVKRRFMLGKDGYFELK